ncbi:glycosyltransferase family 2 protein [Sphingomonas sp. CL5.1]|uniref:glycosyltransferase family 2 protein n=1 Tax=Sphingomonas sp. CL5.1 TaxID=2653203 RepID=UPI0015827AFE|nr:glycosyltransferase family A protein [Sphingomonas sp. CL5.1]QKS01296.1 glycosyltransferase family 2 protein [Sphingomonas sp. CL5.1]
MSAPVVSVVMAAYNGAALIGETLESLATQTLGEFEAIVVDDRSTDDTLAVLRGWPDGRVRAIALEENGGPVRARNRAFAEARGRYIAGLDQDDLCRPERFARQVAYLEANPDVALVGSDTAVLVDGAIRPPRHPANTTPRLTEWLLRIENPLVWSSVMIRADVARRLEPFTRPELLYAEDFDLYHRIARLGRVARVDADLLIYRQHGGGASQRFVETMRASATRVLAGAYAGVFGDGAEEAAALVARNLMGRAAPPDRATLRRLGEVLVALQEDFLTRHDCGAHDVRLIRWETARRWAGVARAGLRAGTLTLGDALAVRPAHMGLGYAGFEELIVSRLVGGARKLRQTFAA